MSFELEQERELFLKALHNAIAWQNRCVELWEIIELFCMDAEAAIKRLNEEIVKLTAYKSADRRKSQSDEVTQAQIDAKREEIRNYQKKIDETNAQAAKAVAAQKKIEKERRGGTGDTSCET